MNSRHRIQEVICPSHARKRYRGRIPRPEPVVLTPGACPAPGPAGQGRALKRRLGLDFRIACRLGRTWLRDGRGIRAWKRLCQCFIELPVDVLFAPRCGMALSAVIVLNADFLVGPSGRTVRHRVSPYCGDPELSHSSLWLRHSSVQCLTDNPCTRLLVPAI